MGGRLELTTAQLHVFGILIIAFGLLITERLRNDIVALLIVLALATTAVLTPEQALAGFGSEPAIVVAGIFVMSAAMHQTGLADTLGAWIGRVAGSGYTRVIAVIMSSVALLSAFTHHVTTTAVMLPVTMKLAQERGIPSSKLLMPLSFAASLGTTITIIGAPAFLIASGALEQAGRPGLGVFSIAPIGLALSAAGIVFMILVGRWLLPDRGAGEEEGRHFKLTDYFTELKILPDSSYVGKPVAAMAEESQFDVVGWVRKGHPRRLQRGTQVTCCSSAPIRISSLACGRNRALSCTRSSSTRRTARSPRRTGKARTPVPPRSWWHRGPIWWAGP